VAADCPMVQCEEKNNQPGSFVALSPHCQWPLEIVPCNKFNFRIAECNKQTIINLQWWQYHWIAPANNPPAGVLEVSHDAVLKTVEATAVVSIRQNCNGRFCYCCLIVDYIFLQRSFLWSNGIAGVVSNAEADTVASPPPPVATRLYFFNFT